MYGKAAISSNKKRGGPKGRGERMGVQTVTEGLISCTATIVSLTLNGLHCLNSNRSNSLTG